MSYIDATTDNLSNDSGENYQLHKEVGNQRKYFLPIHQIIIEVTEQVSDQWERLYWQYRFIIFVLVYIIAAYDNFEENMLR